MTHKYKIADVSRLVYPSSTAHALHTIQMAAAFARQTGDTHLFVRSLAASREQIRQEYDVTDSPLQIWSLHADSLPSPLRRRYMHHYNAAIAAILGLHPAWWRGSGQPKVLFVSSPRERLWWGLARPCLWWLKDWVFVDEAHDVAGLDPEASREDKPFDLQSGPEGQRRQRQLRAMRNFDLMLTVTQALADDLKRWSNGVFQPYVIRNASALPRLSKPPVLRPSNDRVVLGYIGTIDTYRGVDKLLMAMRLLPGNCVLRLVGRIPGHSDSGQGPEWLDDLLSDPDINNKVEFASWVPTDKVTEEVDRCDIVLQPASSHILTLRYASPLKLFDYMVRGKPIVAADVPCHRELLQDGVNARLYRYDDPEHLAACIQSLVERPRQAEALAQAAWEQAADYNYDARAQRILELVDGVWEQRHAQACQQSRKAFDNLRTRGDS